MTEPIQTLEAHATAIRRLEELMSCELLEGSSESQELIELGTRIEAFEKIAFPINSGSLES